MASFGAGSKTRPRLPAKLRYSFKNSSISLIQTLSWLARSFPVLTVIGTFILASFSYVGTLKISTLGALSADGPSDWDSLVAAGVTLWTSKEDGWMWKTSTVEAAGLLKSDHLAIVSMYRQEPLQDHEIETARYALNASDTVFHEGTLALSVPFHRQSTILSNLETAFNAPSSYAKHRTTQERAGWISAKRNSWSPIVNAESKGKTWLESLLTKGRVQTADLAITVSQWVALHITVISLFFAMRRLGSRIWLATSTLISSSFAFLFGLLVTIKLGFPITAGLLLEGVPFFVNTIGFRKHVRLAESIHLSSMKPGARTSASEQPSNAVVQPSAALRRAFEDAGPEVVARYALEMSLSIGGALITQSMVGGLHSFCVLATFVLAFDLLLLFSFFSAILLVKLEATRVRRRDEVGQTLEEDGICHDVALAVAQRTWTYESSEHGNPRTSGAFGKSLTLSRLATFKAVTVGSFVLVNIFNLSSARLSATHPVFRRAHQLGQLVAAKSLRQDKLSDAVAYLLGDILARAQGMNHAASVTILPPLTCSQGTMTPTLEYTSRRLEASVAPAVEGFLESLSDPTVSKWIACAFALSVVFNGYLFKAATTSAPVASSVTPPVDNHTLSKAEGFMSGDSEIGTLISPRDSPLQSLQFVGSEEDHNTESCSQQANVLEAPALKRTQREVADMFAASRAQELADDEVVELAVDGRLPSYKLEKTLNDYTRAVKIRRSVISRSEATSKLTKGLETSDLPYSHYNYADVFGACCENVIGYMPLPLGVAGPLVIDGQSYYVPMATTEGVLVASTSRGCKAINAGGGASTLVTGDGMTRGPCVRFETVKRAGEAASWLQSEYGRLAMKKAFDSTSRFARLESIKTALAGPDIYVRFKVSTGDAMGMNMVSKGVEKSLKAMRAEGFDDMYIVSLSGNFCSDKKPAAVNWIEGRGKSVVAEAIIPSEVVKTVLKTNVDTLVELNISKNLVGSAMAGSIGGFNAHAANLVAAIYIATGQDPAQVVESANCITTMRNLHGDLQVCVSMPSVEVGTLGGGTILRPQGAMLEMLGVRGSHLTTPGENARQLARIVAATTLAGEISLCGALAAGQLVQAHMQHNRSSKQ